MKTTLVTLLFVLVYNAPLVHAGDVIGEIPNPYEPSIQKPLPDSWKWSLAPVVASQGLDIASSYGMRELNPVLAGPQGRFGVQSALLKVGATAAWIGVEYLIVKAHPAAARILTKINWSGAAVTTGFAAHNFSIR
jgi:hypothetical protein